MHEFVEPAIRRLVANQLAVGIDELAPDVSLRDDLVADSLDLAELALVLEREFRFVLSDRVLNAVRSYGDLVETAVGLLLERQDTDDGPETPLPSVWTRLVEPEGSRRGILERIGTLTPYTAETIANDAHVAGPGARLEVMVSAGTSDADLARVYGRFAYLTEHDIGVSVDRFVVATGSGGQPIRIAPTAPAA